MNRLVDVERIPRPRWAGTTAIVHVPRPSCPRCRGELRRLRYRQAALFWSHGHGATLESNFLECARCEWFALADATEVRPDSDEMAIARPAKARP